MEQELNTRASTEVEKSIEYKTKKKPTAVLITPILMAFIFASIRRSWFTASKSAARIQIFQRFVKTLVEEETA